MASYVVSTKPITREKLAKFFPGNHELVRLLETLTQDVVINIPDAVEPATDLLEAVEMTAALASAAADVARGLALQALALAGAADEAPPPVPQVLADAPDDLFAQLSALRERITVAERAIAEIKEGPTP